MDELAIIDIGPLLVGDRAAQRRVDAAVGDAIQQFGGFVVCGYPQSDMVDQWATTMLRFYDLSESAKRSVAARITEPDAEVVYRGYRSSLFAGEWAYNEMFDIGPAEPHPAPDVPGMEVFAERNIWPHPEPSAGWRAAMEQFYELMHEVGMAVMLSAGRWAGFDDADLLARFSTGNSTLRLLNYPVRPEAFPIDPATEFVDGRPVSAIRHTDVAGVSLLWQRQPGLQAEAPDGTWRDVPLVDNAISVHLGTVLQVMTHGRVRATPHRVVGHGVHRQSVAFFVEPGLGSSLAPLADTVDPDLTRTYGWHLQKKYHRSRGYEALVPEPVLPG